jgi:H+/Cl- antiporter ClcA
MSGLAATARAFATYSLVPYLGIVFCPGAVLLGTVGVVRSYRSHQLSSDSGRRVCYTSTIVGVIVLAVQLLLWWILYQAPRWASEF